MQFFSFSVYLESDKVNPSRGHKDIDFNTQHTQLSFGPNLVEIKIKIKIKTLIVLRCAQSKDKYANLIVRQRQIAANLELIVLRPKEL